MKHIEIKELAITYPNKYEYVLNLLLICKNSQQKCYIVLTNSYLQIGLNQNNKLKLTNINPNGKAITIFAALLLKFSYLKISW